MSALRYIDEGRGYKPVCPPHRDPLDPMRGAINGFLIGTVMWVVVVGVWVWIHGGWK